MSILARTVRGAVRSSSTSVQAAAAANVHTTQSRDYKVAVVGAAGGIGQSLSLLLKFNDLITHLALYDVVPLANGVAADVSHCNTPCKVTGHAGPDNLAAALKDADVVVVPAGMPRKPGMTRDDLFNKNANIVQDIAKAASANCPNAALCIITNPVNSTVPIVAETLKQLGTYKPGKLFGVTELDTVRANTFVAENQKFDVRRTHVNVIGGHAGITILPLLSQVKNAKFTQQEKEAITQRVMYGGDEVVKAKAGAGSATLSMAYAGSLFANSVLRARSGIKGIIECAYVESKVEPRCQFFSSPVELGVDGIVKFHPIGKLDEFESKNYEALIPQLQEEIKKGLDYVKNKK